MAQQYWVVIDNTDPTKLAVIGATPKPKSAITRAPIDPLTGLTEEGIWLQIEDIERPEQPGIFDKVATVDEILKNNILGQRAADKIASDLDKKNKNNEFKDIKNKIKGIKKADLSNAESIKQVILDLVDMVLKLEERLINLDEGE